MPKRTKLRYVTEEEYLRTEASASVRHEYVDGNVFAMTGSTDAHNIICGNIFSLIHGFLHGSQCRAYINDMKVRIQAVRSFYYPDIMVSCEPFEPKSVFKISPVLLIEVLSPSTASIDRREKLAAYQKISSLKEYVIVYQDRQRVELYRREADGWELMILSSGEELLLEALPQGPLHLPFTTIYDGYDPPRRVKEPEISYVTASGTYATS